MRWILRSKIHKAIVTGENLNYVGSIGIDKDLIKKVGILAGEKVLVVDNTNGARLETYVIEEAKNSGKIIIYGSACHLIKKGDEIIIMGFELTGKRIKPKIILVDKNNKFVKFL
ncbi:MAG: Aspartate 1-decarboxylase precursor [Parcubacteria group bacterium ADurb.Bin159]|jgi:aspartate 1-decarboxylase|nr:MAG: Aspartate 1-decarboxylase precursor [Parcubacteria group bacterium ADurb.Bin159]